METTTEFLPSFFTNGTGASRAAGHFNSTKENLPFYSLSKFLSQNNQLARAPALNHQQQNHDIVVSSVPPPPIVVVVVAISAVTSLASWTRPPLRPFNLRVWHRLSRLDAFPFGTVHFPSSVVRRVLF